MYDEGSRVVATATDGIGSWGDVGPGGAPVAATAITCLHDIGHVLRDMRAAHALYRRLGFPSPWSA